MVDLVQSTRDRGLTALFEGFFAAAWFGWAQATAPARLGGWLTAGSIGSLLVAAAVSDVAPGTVTGIGAGILLLVFAVIALVRTI
jgi:hypothetical protein